MFRELDANNDGYLNEEELINGYSKYMSRAEAQIEVRELLDNLDVRKRGYIDYTGNV